MNPEPELARQLKQLRLFDIFDSREARRRQAIEGKLAYTEFLALLIGHDVAQQEETKFSPRLCRAQFRTAKTIEQFDLERLPHLGRALAHDLAAGRYLYDGDSVLSAGPCGTGKSHLIQALVHRSVRQTLDVISGRRGSARPNRRPLRADYSYRHQQPELYELGSSHSGQQILGACAITHTSWRWRGRPTALRSWHPLQPYPVSRLSAAPTSAFLKA